MLFKEWSQVFISSAMCFLFLPSGPKECCLVFPISQRSKKKVETFRNNDKTPSEFHGISFFLAVFMQLLMLQILLVKNTVKRSRMEKQRF